MLQSKAWPDKNNNNNNYLFRSIACTIRDTIYKSNCSFICLWQLLSLLHTYGFNMQKHMPSLFLLETAKRKKVCTALKCVFMLGRGIKQDGNKARGRRKSGKGKKRQQTNYNLTAPVKQGWFLKVFRFSSTEVSSHLSLISVPLLSAAASSFVCKYKKMLLIYEYWFVCSGGGETLILLCKYVMLW